MYLDFPAGVGTRNLQPWVGFGSSLSHSWLDAAGPIANPALGDKREQPTAVLRSRQTSRDPLRPQLNSVLEAQIARVYASITGGLRHEQANHVVGQ